MKRLVNPTQEDWFDLWCEDAIKLGYIKKVVKTEDLAPYILAEKVKAYRTVVDKKGRITQKEYTLMEGSEYTPDRLIWWTDKSEGIFFYDRKEPPVGELPFFWAECAFDGYFSQLEVKSPPGSGNRNSSDASFRVKQKWVWQKFDKYIQKVVNLPVKDRATPGIYLWLNTYTPTRYFMSDGLTTRRTISKNVKQTRTIMEFVAMMEAKNKLNNGTI